MSKKRKEEVSIKLLPSKEDMQSNMNNEQSIFPTFHVSIEKETTAARGMYLTSPLT